MMGDGKVIGVEHIEELRDLGYNNLNKSHSDELESGSIIMVTGDGRKGYKDEAPYDVIHVGAAAPTVPQDLIDQLAVGGVLMIPVGPEHGHQSIKLITKISEDEIKEKELLGVMYIPLCDKEHQMKKY